MEKIIKSDILAIVPIYLSNRGDSTLIITKSGNIELNQNIRTVIKNISKYYHLDLKESNASYKEMFCIKKNPPIPFTPEDIFVMVKTRKPLCHHDGAYGYVRIDAIEKIKFKKGKDTYPQIILKNKETLEVLFSLATLEKHLSQGYILENLLHLDYGKSVKESSSLYLEENKPATKGDISLLYMEIKKLQH